MPIFSLLRQPPVFYLSALTTLFERFGFYALSFLIVLFVKATYDYTDIQAFTLFAILSSFAHLTPAIGGYVADNILGIRRSIILGLLLEGSGLMCLAVPTHFCFLFGLSLVVVGEGLFKTGPTNLLGRSYEDKDPRIDGGFTLFYMCLNIGAGLAPILAGFLQRWVGWHGTFLIAGLMTYGALLFYFLLRKTARGLESLPGQKSMNLRVVGGMLGGLILVTAIFAMAFQYENVAYASFFVVTLFLAFYLLFEIIRSTTEERMKLIACILLILMGFAFFILYFQLYTSINLFVHRCVRHTFFGINVPPIVLLSLNAIWVIGLSPVLAMLYSFLGKRGKDLSITSKFPLGIFIITIGFFSLALSTRFADVFGQISVLWIVIALGLYSLGELLISALGVAMVTHIAPRRMYGVMMGAWYLVAASLGAAASAYFAKFSNIPDGLHNAVTILTIYHGTFMRIGIVGLIATLLAFLISPYIKRIAKPR